MKFFSISGLLFVFLIGHGSVRAEQAKLPNIVFILADDLGWADLSSYGNMFNESPNIDKLVNEGKMFTNAYSAGPVCSPTRASIMSGQYPARLGFLCHIPGHWRPFEQVLTPSNRAQFLPEETVTIAEQMKEAGYATGYFGKWHLGDNYPSRPNDQGFDESLIHLSGGMGQVGDFTTFFKGDKSYFDPILWHNGIQESYKGYCSDIFAQNALELALQYAKDRSQFGKQIIKFPRIFNKLIWMLMETTVARQITLFSAREKDNDVRCDIEAGMAKLLAARVAWSNADSALQIHGGNGYALEYPVSRVLCDARILNIFEGAAEIQAQIVIKGLLAK